VSVTKLVTVCQNCESTSMRPLWYKSQVALDVKAYPACKQQKGANWGHCVKVQMLLKVGDVLLIAADCGSADTLHARFGLHD
jgi:hypothetical protein